MSKPKVVNTSTKTYISNEKPYHVAYFRPMKKNVLIKEVGLDPDKFNIQEYFSVSRLLSGETEIKYGASIHTKSLFGYDYTLTDKYVTKDVSEDKDYELSNIADRYYDEVKDMLIKELRSSNTVAEILIKQDIKKYLKDNE